MKKNLILFVVLFLFGGILHANGTKAADATQVEKCKILFGATYLTRLQPGRIDTNPCSVLGILARYASVLETDFEKKSVSVDDVFSNFKTELTYHFKANNLVEIADYRDPDGFSIVSYFIKMIAEMVAYQNGIPESSKNVLNYYEKVFAWLINEKNVKIDEIPSNEKGAELAPIHELITYNLYPIVEALFKDKDLVKRLVNLQSRASKFTVLHFAVQMDLIKFVDLFLKNNPDLEIKNSYGQTALHIAVEKDNTEIIQKLLMAGADGMANDNKGKTPLDIAKKNNDEAMIELIKWFTNKQMEDYFKVVFDTIGIENINYKYNSVASFMNELPKNIDTAKLKSKVKDYKNDFDEAKKMLLHIFVLSLPNNASSLLRTEVAKAIEVSLNEKSPGIKIDINFENKEIDSVLHLAITKGFEDIVKAIINSYKKSLNINLFNGNGETPLTLAIKNNFTSIVKLLIENGADVNLASNELIGKRKSISLKDRRSAMLISYTPLKYAIEAKNLQIVELLVNKGAEISLPADEIEKMLKSKNTIEVAIGKFLESKIKSLEYKNAKWLKRLTLKKELEKSKKN